jgi:hypothetical protein
VVAESESGRPTSARTKSRLTNIAVPLATLSLVIGQGVVLVERTKAAARDGEASEQAAALGIVSGSIWGILLAIAVVAYLRVPAITRARVLSRRFPSAVVVTATRTRDLKNALRMSGDMLPSIFSLLATPTGIEVRTSATEARAEWSLDWKSVLSLSIDHVDGGSRTYRALVVEVRTSADPVFLPFVVTGGGLFGLFELRHESLADLADRFDVMRANGSA